MRHPIYVDHRLETHVIPELYLLYLISISGLIQDKLNFSPNSLLFGLSGRRLAEKRNTEI